MRRALKHVVLLSRISSVAGITWLLRDEFLTDEAAPLASPRTAEPGPGTGVVTGTGTALSITGGKLAYTGAGGDANLKYDTIVRAAGVAASFSVRENATRSNIEFGVRVYLGTGSGLYVDGALVQIGNYSAGVDYLFTLVLRSAGADIYVKGGAYTAHTLLWRKYDAATNPSPSLYGVDGTSSALVDYVRVRQLPAPFNADNGIASVNEATPVSGTSYTATADAITDMAITLPGSPSSGDRMELRYRVQDDDNYMVFYARHSGSAWDVRIDKVEGGSATQLLNVTNVGTPDTLRVITDGNLHDAYTKSGTTWTKRNGQINNSFNAALTTIKPVFEVGSVGSLRSYPRTSPAYAELDRT